MISFPPICFITALFIMCNSLQRVNKKMLTNENLQWVKYSNEIENGSWWWIQNNEENFQFFMNFVHFNLNASKCRERKLIFFDKFPNKCAILATKKWISQQNPEYKFYLNAHSERIQSIEFHMVISAMNIWTWVVWIYFNNFDMLTSHRCEW